MKSENFGFANVPTPRPPKKIIAPLFFLQLYYKTLILRTVFD